MPIDPCTLVRKIAAPFSMKIEAGTRTAGRNVRYQETTS